MCVPEVLVWSQALSSLKHDVLGQIYGNFWHSTECNLTQMLSITTVITVMVNLIPSHSSLNFILWLGSMGHGFGTVF